ncbi:hypothetical protein [Tropicibacter oceani]|uniref:Uncharacterized protein n=1 Tax=Tropicibacter oceani TaxID=3058420 RepID=A0ABY8QDR7_9RHOB|nr:hypothetical protein [Tropicibacter oceani]WGW02771.1 hypothetical protein QF118_12585 [Tropicibacter oceani]
MQVFDLEKARGSLARGLARQAMDDAARESADTGRILADLRAMAPNPRSRQRFAARMTGRRGVLLARAVRDGLVIVLRTVLTVDLRKDGQPCFSEERIAWTRFHLRNAKRWTSFDVQALHVTRHVMQRRIERSDCPMTGVLADMDAAMLRALSRLEKGDILQDRDDDFVPAQRGVWAGGYEQAAVDPEWGPAFRNGPPMQVFAIRTFLSEPEMRPTVWMRWSQACSGIRAA